MAAKANPLNSIIDAGIGIVLGFVGKLFGKSKTKKTLEVLDAQADALMIKQASQDKLISYAKYALIGLLIIVVVFFVIKRRRK